MNAPDRGGLRDKVAFCRRLGAEGMDGISALNLVDDLDGALDALDEAEKERDAAQTAHGELFGTFTETAERLDEAEKALRPFADARNWRHNYDGCGVIFLVGGPSVSESEAAEKERA